MQVAIVDYGSGNLHSALKAVERAARENSVRADIALTDKADAVLAADRIVLPGVGAFADCWSGLAKLPGMIDALREAVEVKARPILGICVGQQLMATRGLEKGTTPGFGWIAGDCKQIAPDSAALKIPQIGWNTLSLRHGHPVIEGIPAGEEGWHAYFVHSFHVVPESDDHLIATTDYGGPVTAVIGRDNIVGTQFHPEKSQKLGLALLGNFLRWAP